MADVVGMNRIRYTLYLAVPATLYLLVAGLVAALYLELPPIGWVGFGIVAAVACAVTAAAAFLFPRMRTNADPSAAPGDATVLVLADSSCPADRLCDALQPRLAGARDVLVVAPVLPSPLHYLTDDERREHVEAEARLRSIVAELRARSIRARGELGADDPVQALDDALARSSAAEVVVASSPAPHWLETDLVAHARRLAPLVEEVVL